MYGKKFSVTISTWNQWGLGLKIGITSITFKCEARVKGSEQAIIQIEKIVFVNLNENGLPSPHNKVKL